jgi:outer membrane protein assembly factor BamB
LSLFPARAAWTSTLGDAAPDGSPGFGADQVYLAVDGSKVIASDLRSGVRHWSVDQPVEFTPVEGGELVFTASATGLHALRVSDGSVVWTRTLPQPAATAPAVAGGWLIATGASAAGGTISAFRASDGEPLWQSEVGSPARVPPTISGDRVYVSTAAEVVALDLSSGERRWARRLGGPVNDVLASGERVFVGSDDKYFYAIDGADGTVLWRWRTGGAVYGRPVSDGVRVYFVSSDNVLRGLDRWNGAQRWKRMLPLRPLTGPVIVGGALLVAGTGSTVYAYAARDGSPLGELPAGGEVFSAPHPVDDVLPIVVVGTRDLAKGLGLMAFTRSIEPAIVPVAPLPDATPLLPLSGDSPAAGSDALRP